MSTMKHWTVDIYISEDDVGRTYAEARLGSGAPNHTIGTGQARLNPADDNVPEIGDELAVARALSDLGHRLLITTAIDIQARTGEEAQLRS